MDVSTKQPRDGCRSASNHLKRFKINFVFYLYGNSTFLGVISVNEVTEALLDLTLS